MFTKKKKKWGKKEKKMNIVVPENKYRIYSWQPIFFLLLYKHIAEILQHTASFINPRYFKMQNTTCQYKDKRKSVIKSLLN